MCTWWGVPFRMIASSSRFLPFPARSITPGNDGNMFFSDVDYKRFLIWVFCFLSGVGFLEPRNGLGTVQTSERILSILAL